MGIRIGRRSLVLLGALAFLVVLGAAAALADTEPNDSYSTAESITLGETESGGINETDEEDYYKFEAGHGDIITIDFMSYAEFHQVLEFKDPQKREVWSIGSDNEIEASNTHYTGNETVVETWYIHIRKEHSGANGAYEFKVTTVKQEDYNTGNDVKESYSDAVAVELDTTITGQIYDTDMDDEYEDAADYYKFTAGNGDIITIDFMSPVDYAGWSMMLRFENSNKEEIWQLGSKVEEEASNTHYTGNETEVGTWYLVVYGEVRLGLGEYEFTVGLAKQDDAGSGNDAMASYGGAVELELGTPAIGLIYDTDMDDEYEDAADYYMFTAGNGDIITIDFISPVDYAGWSMMLRFENSNKEEIWQLGSKAEEEASRTLLTANETEVGTWYLIVYGEVRLGLGEYEFTVTVTKQDDAGSGNDVMADDANAFELAAGTYTGKAGHLDEADAYMVGVGAGWTLYTNLTNPYDRDMTLKVLDDEKVEVGTLTSKDDVVAEGEYVIPGDVSAGSFYYLMLDFSYGNEHMTDYTLEVGIVEAAEDTEAPAITHTTPTGWQETVDMTVAADVTDNVGVTGVKLFHRVTGAADFTELAMTASSGDTYEATVPGASVTADGVEYYIWATDEAGNEATHPAGGASAPVSVTDVDPPPDTEPPVLDHTPPKNLKSDKDGKFTVTVTDNQDVVLVTLYYRYKGDPVFLPLVMTKGEGDEYTATIPKLLMKEGKLEYYMEATDSAGNEGTYQSVDSPNSVKVKKPEEGPGFGTMMAVMALIAIPLVLASRRRR